MSTIQGLLTVLGRIALCTIFFTSAAMGKIPHFNDYVKMMEGAGVPSAKLMLVGAIVFLIVGSILVVIGFKARFGAFLLLIFLILATYYFHAFWNVPADKPQELQDQMIQFMKNLSMAGAMLFIMGNGAGPMSLDNRMRSTDVIPPVTA